IASRDRKAVFVEITASFLRFPRTLASISSDCPLAYMSATSKKLMPASSARLTIASASCWPVFQTALRGSEPEPEPKVMTPKAKRETMSPELPKRTYCIFSLQDMKSSTQVISWEIQKKKHPPQRHRDTEEGGANLVSL